MAIGHRVFQALLFMILGAGLFYIVTMLPQDSQWTDAAEDLYSVEAGLLTFQANYGRYPTQTEGLKALISRPDTIEDYDWYGPFLPDDVSIVDPWGMPYIYYPESTPGVPYTLQSFGSDRSPGGQGDAQDIQIYFD